MDFGKLLALASALKNGPALVAQGLAFVQEVKSNADRARHILSEGDRAELDAVHAETLAAAAALDAKLAVAERT